MASNRKVTLEGLMDKIKADEVKALNLVLKADMQGSVEVLRDTLAKLSTDEVAINIIHASAGAITANDILLASASQAIVIGFNVRPERSAKELAEREKVDVRLYSVIYHLTDELQKAMIGTAPADVQGGGARPGRGPRGVQGLQGGHHRRLHGARGQRSCAPPRPACLRDNVVIWEGNLASLKRFKDDVSEVKNGFECGIGLEKYHDIKLGDVIEAYRTVEVAREA